MFLRIEPVDGKRINLTKSQPFISLNSFAHAHPPSPAIAPSSQHAIPEGYDVERIRRDFPALTQQVSAQPLMKFLGLEGVLCISFGYFNTHLEIDQFVDALQECIRAEG